MSVDRLLLWMSARRYGSWQQFRAAVEELHLSGLGDVDGEGGPADDQPSLAPYQKLRFNLQRAGHAEFFAGAGGNDWRVTPPTLAVTQNAQEWLGILVGARSPSLLRRLHGGAGSTKVRTIEFTGYPQQILLTATSQGDLSAVAEQAGLLMQRNAPAALLMSLPAIDDSCVRYPTELPFGAGWKIERFSSETLGWRSTTLQDAATARAGLFRFALKYQRHILFCSGGAAFRIPSQVGKYLILRRRRHQVIRYDVDKRSMTVPASCGLPFLIERALILCSGSPPSLEGGPRIPVLLYSEVPGSIAAMAASLLRQELR